MLQLHLLLRTRTMVMSRQRPLEKVMVMKVLPKMMPKKKRRRQIT